MVRTTPRAITTPPASPTSQRQDGLVCERGSAVGAGSLVACDARGLLKDGPKL